MNRLPPGTTIRIFVSAKAGHVVQCRGLAQALGVEPELCPVTARKFYTSLAPWGPADPCDQCVVAPFPDIAIASARETVPVLRKLKRLAGNHTFAIYLGDPRVSHSRFDLIWTPEHDRVRGGNIFKTLTSPHLHDAQALDEARAHPDARLAALRGPGVACFLGGPSGQYAFGAKDIAHVTDALGKLLSEGASLMVSPSRRTPPAMMLEINALAADAPDRAFVWDGSGDNPYRQMLALADAFLVTCDSTNMVGEALAAGRPVHVLQLEGKSGKFRLFYEQLRARGLIRDWQGRLEDWPSQPVDATTEIAAEVAARYAAFRRKNAAD